MHKLWGLLLYSGPYSGKSRPKIYDGKVNIEKDPHRFDDMGELNTGESIYTGVVHSRCLKCPIRVVMLRIQRDTKIGLSLLYSIDTKLEGMTIIRYYKARCQIEFIFRDEKQYIGLMDCQSCQKEPIHTRINASFAALNALKLEDKNRLMRKNIILSSNFTLCSHHLLNISHVTCLSWLRKLQQQNVRLQELVVEQQARIEVLDTFHDGCASAQ